MATPKIRIDNDLERKRIVYLSIWVDVDVLWELKIKGLIIGKGVVTLEWLTWHECVSYVGNQDDSHDCAR